MSGDGLKIFKLERWSISKGVPHMSLVRLPAGDLNLKPKH